MKKIKHIKQLKAEQKKLGQREKELESKIRTDWEGIKAGCSAGHIASDVFETWRAKKTNGSKGDHTFSGIISFGVGMLTQKLFNKVDNLFK